MKSEEKTFKIIYYIILGVVALFSLLPIIYVVSSSFKTNSEIMTNSALLFPKNPTLENYRVAWNGDNFNIASMTFNSTWYTLISVLITLTTSSMSGCVFARLDFPGKKVIFAVFSATLFINMGSITIYPLFEILSNIGLANNLWGLVVMKFFGIGVANIYIVRGFINTLPYEIDEAAYIDGCSFFGVYWRIILPLLKPVVATIGILAFQGSWNDYLMPTLFTITRPEQRTLIVGIMALKNSGQAASSWNLMLAGASVALIPVLIAYAFGNKYFVSGLTAGAVKG